ncbi:MAG: hypothetical protein ACRC50_03540 [Gaiella sp.]
MPRTLLCSLVCVAAVAVLAVPAAPAAPKPTTVTITVVKGRPVGGIKRPSVKKGTVVRFVVRADRGEYVHLHGYDVERAVRAGRPTVIQVATTIPGRFELELHEPDALLAQLTVRP